MSIGSNATRLASLYPFLRGRADLKFDLIKIPPRICQKLSCDLRASATEVSEG